MHIYVVLDMGESSKHFLVYANVKRNMKSSASFILVFFQISVFDFIVLRNFV